ncbi:unannotated protein [freshwater metagenome]|uniref:Unannotated protein n=1 Tax=freshwater metagenome TaxID=449393 RepID=A0A6J5YEQ5_9ZZZZ
MLRMARRSRPLDSGATSSMSASRSFSRSGSSDVALATSTLVEVLRSSAIESACSNSIQGPNGSFWMGSVSRCSRRCG